MNQVQYSTLKHLQKMTLRFIGRILLRQVLEPIKFGKLSAAWLKWLCLQIM